MTINESGAYNDPSGWPDAIDWMERTRKSYEQAIADVVAETVQ